MNGYLVFLSCFMDDFPVFLCDDYGDALRYAEDCNPHVLFDEMDEIFNVYPSTPYCIKIVTVVAGKPTAVEFVRDLDEEEESDEADEEDDWDGDYSEAWSDDRQLSRWLTDTVSTCFRSPGWGGQNKKVKVFGEGSIRWK